MVREHIEHFCVPGQLAMRYDQWRELPRITGHHTVAATVAPYEERVGLVHRADLVKDNTLNMLGFEHGVDVITREMGRGTNRVGGQDYLVEKIENESLWCP